MIYLAAVLIVVGVALFVAAPLAGAAFKAGAKEPPETVRLNHERELAMQGLRELEFDREMGKLSQADYASLRAPLEARALAAMGALAARSTPSARRSMSTSAPLAAVSPLRRADRSVPPIGGATQSVRFCPECGLAVAPAHKFCAGCGTPIPAPLRAAGEAG
ncbi:MAG: c-type cytochrome biogenesis protein CcmI [Candidatus Binataceae bacterium]|nr:c-type cytochrome biogenesis protein CcmI [Candidatus Binataceae bacterium]